jgi:hypothetical protein
MPEFLIAGLLALFSGVTALGVIPMPHLSGG